MVAGVRNHLQPAAGSVPATTLADGSGDLGARAPQRPTRARTSVAPVGGSWKRPTNRSPSRVRMARNGWSPLVWCTQSSDSRTSKLTATPLLPANRRACGTPPTTCVSARCRRPWPRAPVWTSSTSTRPPRGFPQMPRPVHSPVHRPATFAGGPGGTRSPHHCSACARARSASDIETSPPLPFRAENARCALDAKCVGCSAHVANCFGPAQAPTDTPAPTTSATIVRMLCPPRRRPPEESPAPSATASAGPPRSDAESGACRGGVSAARRRCHLGTMLWHRAPRQPASEFGGLRQGSGGHLGSDRRRRVLMLPTLRAQRLYASPCDAALPPRIICQRWRTVSTKTRSARELNTPTAEYPAPTARTRT